MHLIPAWEACEEFSVSVETGRLKEKEGRVNLPFGRDCHFAAHLYGLTFLGDMILSICVVRKIPMTLSKTLAEPPGVQFGSEDINSGLVVMDARKATSRYALGVAATHRARFQHSSSLVCQAPRIDEFVFSAHPLSAVLRP